MYVCVCPLGSVLSTSLQGNERCYATPCILLFPYSLLIFCSATLLDLSISARILLFFFYGVLSIFNVSNDAKSLHVHHDDLFLVLVPVHAPVLVLSPLVFCSTLALDLALVHALCSDRHNTYTSHVSQLSQFFGVHFFFLFFWQNFLTTVFAFV